MDDADDFEWDNDKAARNYAKHDVTFQQAIKVFRDILAIAEIDEWNDYGEERINLIGMCSGVILHVTYTERGKRIRLISARKATKHERENYYRQNAR